MPCVGDVISKGSVRMEAPPLPSFDAPPVVETVLGVQFDPIPRLTNAHLGAFWKSLGPDWSEVKDVPPLPQESETFGDQPRWPGVLFHLTQDTSTRLQVRNQTRDRMIQIQNGRFHLNWLGLEGGEYPRYGKTRPEFDSLFGKLTGFLAEEQLKPVRLNQWEITYVNHIKKGSQWGQPSDWINIFRDYPVSILHQEGMNFESHTGCWHYEIFPKKGRLHVELLHGRSKQDEILILKLTARGPIEAGDDSGLAKGLDLGHESIVRGFEKITSAEAHKLWRKKQ